MAGPAETGVREEHQQDPAAEGVCSGGGETGRHEEHGRPGHHGHAGRGPLHHHWLRGAAAGTK